MATNNLQTYNPKARILSDPFFCVENEFYHNLSLLVERKKILPILNNPAFEGDMQFKTHSPMSRWEGLYSNLARASAEYLKGCKVVLPATTIQNKAFALSAMYMLETGAVVYQSNGKNGITAMICTKNRHLIRSELKLSQSRFAELDGYCIEKTEEIVAGKLKVAAFGMTSDGFTSSRCRTVSVNVKNAVILPLMSCLQFDKLLLNMIRDDRGAIRLIYLDRLNNRQEIVTSLNPQIVHAHLGNSIDPSTFGRLNPEMPAPILMSLVDLQKRTVVDVPITQIIDAKLEA